MHMFFHHRGHREEWGFENGALDNKPVSHLSCVTYLLFTSFERKVLIAYFHFEKWRKWRIKTMEDFFICFTKAGGYLVCKCNGSPWTNILYLCLRLLDGLANCHLLSPENQRSSEVQEM
ncbi:MAG: hypothetical protein K8T10_11075 [Candidatus Eremiobacteraeota bacterium]|nr:hypothetical protein [Candidatus Eremiobacteraeota bacterium]